MNLLQASHSASEPRYDLVKNQDGTVFAACSTKIVEFILGIKFRFYNQSRRDRIPSDISREISYSNGNTIISFGIRGHAPIMPAMIAADINLVSSGNMSGKPYCCSGNVRSVFPESNHLCGGNMEVNSLGKI